MFKCDVNYGQWPSADTAEPMEETMGDRIRTLRSSRKLTQERLAEEMGVSGAAISQWEKGNTKDLKLENFLRFCSIFNCDPLWLAFGPDGPPWSAKSKSHMER